MYKKVTAEQWFTGNVVSLNFMIFQFYCTHRILRNAIVGGGGLGVLYSQKDAQGGGLDRKFGKIGVRKL